MRDQDLSRRRLMLGSSAVVAGALLLPGGRPGPVPRSAQFGAAEGDGGPLLLPGEQSAKLPRPGPFRAAGLVGATVSPRAYGMRYSPTWWVDAAHRFDSYVGLRLATRLQKIYLMEGEYYTDPLPGHITSLARAGCQFIICVYPSRSRDDRARLARFLRLLTRRGIVYQAALVNEWNGPGNFASADAYLRYWRHYAPVIKAARVPLCNLVLASSNKADYAKMQRGFPVNPLPDRYWIDYYATGFQWKVRLDTPGGPLDHAHSHGVPAGIAEFGIGANGVAPISVWDEFCHYLVGLTPRLPLGRVYWGSVNHGRQDVVTGPNDRKVPGIRRVMASG
jgi:hypothetical protein